VLLLVVPGSLAGVGPMELLLIAVVAVIVPGPDVMRKS
jgi:Sec-independent protein translocase protein TatA